MQLSVKYGNIIVRMTTGLLVIAALAGCANQPQAGPVAANAIHCMAAETLVCAHRMGKVISCACKSQAALDDIF